MTTETRSAFGEVFAALMEKRGITATPGNMFELAAEEYGLRAGRGILRLGAPALDYEEDGGDGAQVLGSR